MKLIKTREFLVSMGNYENIKFGATVEVSTEDFPEARSLDDLDEIASDFLDKSLEPDIEEARANTDEPDSYIHIYQQETN